MPHTPARHRSAAPARRHRLRRPIAALCATGVAVTTLAVGLDVVQRDDEATAAVPDGTLPTGVAESEAATRSAERPELPAATVAQGFAQAATDLKEKQAEAAKKAKEEAARKQAIEDAKDDPRAAALAMFPDFGWDESQMPCLDALWTRESGWNYQAENPSSGAYGIPQSLPGSKMGTVADDWRENPLTQIRWGLQYIERAYSTPCGADSHSQDVGHY